MAQCKNVEKKIFEVEDFKVQIKDRDGSNVRDERELGCTYTKVNAADGNWTVDEWKRKRFEPDMSSGYKVDVLDYDGKVVKGHTKLKTVRTSYLKKERG